MNIQMIISYRLLRKLKKRGTVISVYDIKELREIIKKAKKLKPKRIKYMPKKMLGIIKKKLEEFNLRQPSMLR